MDRRKSCWSMLIHFLGQNVVDSLFFWLDVCESLWWLVKCWQNVWRIWWMLLRALPVHVNFAFGMLNAAFETGSTIDNVVAFSKMHSVPELAWTKNLATNHIHLDMMLRRRSGNLAVTWVDTVFNCVVVLKKISVDSQILQRFFAELQVALGPYFGRVSVPFFCPSGRSVQDSHAGPAMKDLSETYPLAEPLAASWSHWRNQWQLQPNDPNAGDWWCNTLRMFEDVRGSKLKSLGGRAWSVQSTRPGSDQNSRSNFPSFLENWNHRKRSWPKYIPIASHSIPLHPDWCSFP